MIFRKTCYLSLMVIAVYSVLSTQAHSMPQLQPKARASDGEVHLTWTLSANRAVRIHIYRADAPNDKGVLLAAIRADANQYVDHIENWLPHYYWLAVLDANGQAFLTSTKVAAFARPREGAAACIETFAFWYELYKPSNDPDASMKHIGSASYLIGPTGSHGEVARDLAKANIGLLAYMTFYQTANWAEKLSSAGDMEAVRKIIAPICFYRRDLQFSNAPIGYLPSIFCRPGSVEYNPRTIQYTTCPNSTPFRKMVLDYANKQLGNGIMGYFMDNGFNDDIAGKSECQSTDHAHYYGDHLNSADAYLGLLMEVACAVKRKNPRGIIMENGGLSDDAVPPNTEFYGLKIDDLCDGFLWESYLRSSYNTEDKHSDDWQSVYKRSVELEKRWPVTSPHHAFVLSYPWNRSEAFFCYATAKLFNFPWAAGLGINDPHHEHFGGHFGTYPELLNLRLGAPSLSEQYGGLNIDSVYVRRYEGGLVAVNPTKKEVAVTIPLDQDRRYRDVFDRKEGSGHSIIVTLPPKSGRVYLWLKMEPIN